MVFFVFQELENKSLQLIIRRVLLLGHDVRHEAACDALEGVRPLPELVVLRDGLQRPGPGLPAHVVGDGQLDPLCVILCQILCFMKFLNSNQTLSAALSSVTMSLLTVKV